jgi:enolase-phosphatase E1
VTVNLAERGVQAVVLDIEGTTTAVEFVYDVLFPFARRALPSYIREHLDAPGLQEPLRRLRDEWMDDVARGQAPPLWQDDDREQRIAGIATYAAWLMDRDRKSPALKTLQGEIWARGYEEGLLRGEVYPDVQPALARWHDAGIDLAIFSSGSVLAQQLLFRTTSQGDLTRYITAFFDTAVGAKVVPESYRRIANTLGRPPDSILFISDTLAELSAARTAGWAALLCTRKGPAPSVEEELASISDFGEVQ